MEDNMGDLNDNLKNDVAKGAAPAKNKTLMGAVGIVVLFAAPVAIGIASSAHSNDHVRDPFFEWLSYEQGYYTLMKFGVILSVIGIYCIWMAWMHDWIVPCVMLAGAPAAWLYCNSAVSFEPGIRSMGELFHWMAGYSVILNGGIAMTVCGIVMLIVKATVLKAWDAKEGKK